MARIAGVNIPTAKRVVIALRYIHGIGPKFAQEICEKVGIPAERRVQGEPVSFRDLPAAAQVGAGEPDVAGF